MRLKDVASFQNKKTSSKSLNNNNYISTENILQNFEGIIDAASIPFNTRVVEYKERDILLSNIRPYLKKVWLSDRKGGCSSDVFVLRGGECDQCFLYYIIASDRFINYVMTGAKGVKMPRGDKSQMLDFRFSIPYSAEQKKITNLLSLLDNKIACQSEAIEKLQSLITGLYQKLFSSPFDRGVCLDKVCEIIKGQQINGDKLTKEGEYYVMNGGVEPSGYFNEANVPEGTISVSEGGNCGYVQYNERAFWSSGHCYTLQNLTPAIDKKYLYHYLKASERDIMKLSVGSALKNLQKKDLGKYIVRLPGLSHQKRLATIMDAIERKVKAEKAIAQLYIKEKNHLLKNMFI